MRTLGLLPPGGLVLACCLIGICGLGFLMNICAWGEVSQAVTVQSAAASSDTSLLENHRLTKLLGMTVVNEDSQELGRLKNFVMEPGAGRAVYAVVCTGGFLGVGQRAVLVPAPALSMATTQKGMLAMNMRLKRWKDAPGFKRHELSRLNSPAQTRRIYEFYRQSDPARLTETGRELPEDQGSPAASGQPSNTFCMASELLGDKLVNNQGKKLGKVCDLLLDFSGRKPALAVFSRGGILTARLTYATPLIRLKRTDENRLALDLSLQTLHRAAPLNEQAWKEACDSPDECIFRLQKHKAGPRSEVQEKQALRVRGYFSSESRREPAPALRTIVMKGFFIQPKNKGENYGKNRYVGSTAGA